MLTIREIKSKIAPLCEKYNINKIILFGSYARGEANETSDIDFQVFFSEKIGLVKYNLIKRDFEMNLKAPIDFITKVPKIRAKGVDYYSRFRNNLKNEGILLYERKN